MLELILCSLVTILPDYLVRRYVQGKRFGREITFFSVWYELRYGITTCVVLTILLITVIFYYHPSTTTAALLYRAAPIVPETNGRVAEIFVGFRGEVEAGDPIFSLDSSAQKAAAETARRRVAELDAQAAVAETDLAAALGQLRQAEGAYAQARDELAAKSDLRARNADVVAGREIERLQNVVESRQGAVDAARAAQEAVEIRMSALIPAQKASAEAELAQAEIELSKTVVRAGVSGRVEQFTLRVGDIVNPVMRPAGVLIPKDAGRRTISAGFGQIEAQVLKVGMVAEIACPSLPLTIVPMVVVEVQPVIASGQVRASDQLVDITALGATPGTILAFLEPLYEGGLDRLPPGASCIANAYSNHHDALADPSTGTARYLFFHAVDALALVHAMILRVQALMLPVRTLVLSGH